MVDFEHDFLELVACVGHERRGSVRAILLAFERMQDAKWGWVSSDEHRGFLPDGPWAKSISFYWLGELALQGGLDISRGAQAHAWFLSLVAREGLVWYCYEHWSQVPASDRQATGTIIIAGLLFVLFDTISPANSRVRSDLMRCLLRSGVNPNTKYTWIRNDPFSQLTVSLWEAYVEAFSHVWTSKAETDILKALEMLQLLLHDGLPDKNCRLPAGNESLLSALTLRPHGEEKIRLRQNRWWSKFAERLHNLLDAHGLLTPEERHTALE